jgi:hypothetical protein
VLLEPAKTPRLGLILAHGSRQGGGAPISKRDFSDRKGRAKEGVGRVFGRWRMTLTVQRNRYFKTTTVILGGSPRFLAGAVGEGGDRRLTFTMLDQDVVAVTDRGGPLRAFPLRGQSTLPKGISEAFVTPSSIAFAR